MATPNSNYLINQFGATTNNFGMPSRGVTDDLPRPPVINRREIHLFILIKLLYSLITKEKKGQFFKHVVSNT